MRMGGPPRSRAGSWPTCSCTCGPPLRPSPLSRPVDDEHTHGGKCDATTASDQLTESQIVANGTAILSMSRAAVGPILRIMCCTSVAKRVGVRLPAVCLLHVEHSWLIEHVRQVNKVWQHPVALRIGTPAFFPARRVHLCRLMEHC